MMSSIKKILSTGILLIILFDLISGLGADTRSQNYLKKVSEEEFENYVNLAVDAVKQIDRLEGNLVNYDIVVRNGTISHATLLDVLPENGTMFFRRVALEMLKTAQFFYHSVCNQMKISVIECRAFLTNESIPNSSTVSKKCKELKNLTMKHPERFRRLLPPIYVDGFYEMAYDLELPSPRNISKNFISLERTFDDKFTNLFLLSWIQFMEHDISKPIATMMFDGAPIECCNKFNTRHSPRHVHPSCAPILESNREGRYTKETCLNYVRSSFAVPRNCSFNYADQINQATGDFDLSNLYGCNGCGRNKMRLYSGGLLKISHSEILHESLLPLVENDHHHYCTFKSNEPNQQCFIAGDSRVNYSPFTILIYTLFLRNHNQIAQLLQSKFNFWNDEQLFQEARSLNIDIYNRIIFDELLPQLFGNSFTSELREKAKKRSFHLDDDFEVSNEFAVAAIRFYLSMVPHIQDIPINASFLNREDDNKFQYNAEIYKPITDYSVSKVNKLLEFVLKQRAMKYDSFYEKPFIPENLYTSGNLQRDVLAFDIQRGRDHGLQSYASYLQLATGKKVSSWSDLTPFFSESKMQILKSIYAKVQQIDLLIGAVSEKPKDNFFFGETFTYIFVEQLTRNLIWYQRFKSMNFKEGNKTLDEMKLADLVCSNSYMEQVPTFLFKIPSERNPLMSCENYIRLRSYLTKSI